MGLGTRPTDGSTGAQYSRGWRYHFDFNAENNDPQRAADALSHRFCQISEAGGPDGTHDADGQPALVDAGTGDREGQACRQGCTNLLDDQRPLARPAFERGEFVSSS